MFPRFSTGQKPANALLTLHYDNGGKSYEMKQAIQPGDQMWVDVASLIRNRVPDRKGSVLPADTSFGTYEVHQSSAGPGTLIADSLALDGTYGMQASPQYPICCGYTGITMDPSSFTDPLGTTDPISVLGTDECSGFNDVLDPFFTSWGSDNPSIALVTPEKLQAVGAGVTTAFTNGELLVGNGGYCTLQKIQVSAPVTVQVPTSLSVLNVTVLPNGPDPPDGCPGSQNYGIKIDIKYQVLDQNGTAIHSAGMIPHENGTFFTGGGYDNNIGPVEGYPTSSATTAADGTFHDVPFGICQSLPIGSAGLTNVQHITIIMPDGSAPGVRTQTFTVTAPGTQSFGHGSISNSVGDISATR